MLKKTIFVLVIFSFFVSLQVFAVEGEPEFRLKYSKTGKNDETYDDSKEYSVEWGISSGYDSYAKEHIVHDVDVPRGLSIGDKLAFSATKLNLTTEEKVVKQGGWGKLVKWLKWKKDVKELKEVKHSPSTGFFALSRQVSDLELADVMKAITTDAGLPVKPKNARIVLSDVRIQYSDSNRYYTYCKYSGSIFREPLLVACGHSICKDRKEQIILSWDFDVHYIDPFNKKFRLLNIKLPYPKVGSLGPWIIEKRIPEGKSYETDIAILRIGEILKEGKRWLDEELGSSHYPYLTVIDFKDDIKLDASFGYLFEVVMYGYPYGLSSTSNMPLARFGHCSSDPKRSIQQDDNSEDIDFYVDMPAIEGSSGSPVWFHLSKYSIKKKFLGNTNLSLGNEIEISEKYIFAGMLIEGGEDANAKINDIHLGGVLNRETIASFIKKEVKEPREVDSRFWDNSTESSSDSVNSSEPEGDDGNDSEDEEENIDSDVSQSDILPGQFFNSGVGIDELDDDTNTSGDDSGVGFADNSQSSGDDSDVSEGNSRQAAVGGGSSQGLAEQEILVSNKPSLNLDIGENNKSLKDKELKVYDHINDAEKTIYQDEFDLKSLDDLERKIDRSNLSAGQKEALRSRLEIMKREFTNHVTPQIVGAEGLVEMDTKLDSKHYNKFFGNRIFGDPLVQPGISGL